MRLSIKSELIQLAILSFLAVAITLGDDYIEQKLQSAESAKGNERSLIVQKIAARIPFAHPENTTEQIKAIAKATNLNLVTVSSYKETSGIIICEIKFKSDIDTDCYDFLAMLQNKLRGAVVPTEFGIFRGSGGTEGKMQLSFLNNDGGIS